jgi:predicted transcriptional regulator
VKTRNLTVALPEDLVRRLKIIAAQRESSISRLLVEALSEITDEEAGFHAARKAMIADLREGAELGTHGQVFWSRDSVHER